KTNAGNVTTPIPFERENVSGRAASAVLQAKTKKLALKGGVEMTVKPDAGGQQTEAAGLPNMKLRGLPLTIKSAQADFDQMAVQLNFSRGAVAEHGADAMSGDTLGGLLNEQKRVKHIW